jgi:hypothetical protein
MGVVAEIKAKAASLNLCVKRAGHVKFDDPIPLPGGRQFVTLEDAGNHITKLPKARAFRARMAGCDAGLDARRARRAYRARQERRHRGAAPARRPRVQVRSEEPHWGERKLKRDR